MPMISTMQMLIKITLGSVLMLATIVTAGVWIWALFFHALHLFPTLEACVYFVLVAFTMLGFGDLRLPQLEVRQPRRG